jgi:Xaa-Pro aminopeptidase
MVQSRHERLRRGLDERGCDAAILVGTDHVMHLTGYGRYLSTGALAVVACDGELTLVVPRHELSAAEAEADADEVVAYGSDDFLDFDPIPKLLATCRQAASGRIGVAGLELPDTESVDSLMIELRQIKDDDELERIRASHAIALAAQCRIAELASSGASEIDLFSAAQSLAQTEASAPVEFVGGVSTGPNSADVAPPVHVPGSRQAKHGEPVLADVALRHRGYWGDTTRTSIVGGNREIEEMRSRITEILNEASRSLAPGIKACEVFSNMRGSILRAFPDGRFPHHAGHAIGLDVAEDPQLIPTEEMPLEAGMVFALEPGVYFPGRFGVRVEDMFIVTRDGGLPLDEAAPESIAVA